MKKYFFILAFFMFVFFGSRVHAAGSEDYAKFQEGFYERYNVYIGNENVSTIVNRWETDGTYLYSGINGNYYYFVISSESQRLNNNSFDVHNGDVMYVRSSNQISSNTDYGYFQTSQGSFTCTNAFFWDSYDEFMNPVDYDNIYSDPLLESPSFYINNNIHTGNYNIDLSFNQVAYVSPYQNVPVYLYVKAYLYTPASVYADYNSFTTNSYYKSDPIVIFDYNDMHASDINQTYDLNDYNDGVMDFIEYAAENRTIDSPSGMSAGTLLSRGTALSNMLTKGFPYGDNNIEIWACYYYVLDSKVYQSAWTKWNSKRNSTYEKIVPVQQDYPTDGIIDVIDYSPTVEDQDTTDFYNPVGTETGSNEGITVNVNTNVPNYPDYPTIQKYNHDSLLVQFINTAKYLRDNQNGFFGQFGLFLSSMFGFIPSSYWTIVGFGLLGTIVVMILKIL